MILTFTFTFILLALLRPAWHVKGDPLFLYMN